MQDEKLQILAVQKENAADSSLLLQQSLDDSTVANKVTPHETDGQIERETVLIERGG